MPLYLLLSLFRLLLLLKVSIKENPPLLEDIEMKTFFSKLVEEELDPIDNTNIFLLDTQWRLQFRVCLDR